MTKVAVITGASSGIGAATARVFAEAGYALALGARRLERLESLAEELKSAGATEVVVARLDVCDADSVTDFVVTVLRELGGRVDVLVNNAGLALAVDSLEDGDPADWQTMLDTNVIGLSRVSQAFIPTLKQQKDGHIVNIGSIAGHFTYAGGAVYAGSKHAVKAINGALRLELSGTNIRVTSVDPGMVETEFSLVRLRDQKKADSVYTGMTPLTGKDVADCVFFAATRPPHVNLDHIIVMPTDQAAVHKVHRES